MQDPDALTTLLGKIREGDAASSEQALQAVYGEMHRIAVNHMRRESSDHTLQPTALVNEAYLRMVSGGPLDIRSRNHFFALAAQAMRRVLVDHAREKKAGKRGGGGLKVEVSDSHASVTQNPVDVLELDGALRDLAALDPRAARVVELRFFGGHTDKEVCEILGESSATVRRDWDFAKVWLKNKIGGIR